MYKELSYHRGTARCAVIKLERLQTAMRYISETGQCTNAKISPQTGVGPPYNAIEILAPSPKNFEKLGVKYFGVGPPWPIKGTFLAGGPRVARGVG